jgi:2-dehydro-3-deoxygluconokinase
MRYDLISLGEPLLRLAPPDFIQLRKASSLNVLAVGSQLNVAANLARLGKKTALLTQLPLDSLGHLVIDACRSYGVDVSHIKMIPGAKMGITYVEFSAAPRAPLAVYDRKGSAASMITPEDFDWDQLLATTRFAHTDGIFPGLSLSCCQATEVFVASAKRNGCVTCFDVNYREHLWSPETAREAWSRILPEIDLLVTNRSVSELVFGYKGSDEDLMRSYADQFGCKAVCLTHREMLGVRRGAWTSQALSNGKVAQGRRYEFDIVDRYGAGDAWFAGFLFGYMEKDVPFALDFANALCALAHTIEGDVAHVTPADVQAIMGEHTDLRVRR